jgi:hypothetical protein
MDEYRLFGGFVRVLDKQVETRKAMAEGMPRLTFKEFLRSIGLLLAGKPQVPDSLAGNELLRIISRRSQRRFTPQPVEEDVFAAILSDAWRLDLIASWTFMAFTADSGGPSGGRPLQRSGR